MDDFLRELVRQIYVFRCGYCDSTETEIGARLTIDHFMPQSAGGGDERENLVYSCHACNMFKADYRQPNSVQRILHPLDDDLTVHFFERSDGLLESLTPTGKFHIERLRLNRPPYSGATTPS